MLHRQARRSVEWGTKVCAIALLALGVVGVASCGEPGDFPDGASHDPDECRDVGRYEVGKEGGYAPCCEGLHEISTLKASYGTEGEVLDCQDADLRTYACILGTCGDGTCEPEENDCGCPRDCGD